MAKTISPRFGVTRWSADPDTWSRAEIDADMGAFEANAVFGRVGTAAGRGTPARDRELFIASDTGAVAYGAVAGGAWQDLARLGAAQSFSALQTMAAGAAVAGGLAVDSVTASKSIFGAVGVQTFTTEAARDAFYTGIGGITGIQICRLSAPTVGQAGLYFYDGTRWRPVQGHRIYNRQAASTAAGTLTFGAPPTGAIDTTGGMWVPATGIFTAAYQCVVTVSAIVTALVGSANQVMIVSVVTTGSAPNLPRAKAPQAPAGGSAMQAVLPPTEFTLNAGDTFHIAISTDFGATLATQQADTAIDIRVS